jgi:hypothetical protein
MDRDTRIAPERAARWTLRDSRRQSDLFIDLIKLRPLIARGSPYLDEPISRVRISQHHGAETQIIGSQ